MDSQEKAAIHELNHVLQLAEGSGERQLEQMRQTYLVAARGVALVRKIRRLIEIILTIRGGDNPVDPVIPPVVVPAQVVWSLQIEEYADSSLWFEIDNNGKRFTLEPRLAGLLKFLAHQPDKVDSAEDLVGFRSRSEVLAYLEKTGGRKYNSHIVTQMVGKLRKKLEAFDERKLVVTTIKDGIRFLVRRRAVQYLKFDKLPPRKPAAGAANAATGGSSAAARLPCSRKVLTVKSGVLSSSEREDRIKRSRHTG